MSLVPIAGFSTIQLTHRHLVQVDSRQHPTVTGRSPGQRRQRRTVYPPAAGAGERAASRRSLNEGMPPTYLCGELWEDLTREINPLELTLGSRQSQSGRCRGVVPLWC